MRRLSTPFPPQHAENTRTRANQSDGVELAPYCALMRPTRPIFANAHRLSRLVAWLRLWLAWAVGAFGVWMSQGERPSRRALDKIARFACHLVVFHACARVCPRWRRSAHRHGRLKRLTRRVVIGARLRKAVRGHDFAARLLAILTFVRDMERHIAHAARRLRAGFSRLRILYLQPEPALALSRTPRSAIACADTS
jgi:hypothetical protein